jgi:hypothetical protein
MKSQARAATAFLKARLVTGSEVATQIERLTTCELRERKRFAFAGVSRAAINLPRARRRKFANKPARRSMQTAAAYARRREDGIEF